MSFKNTDEDCKFSHRNHDKADEVIEYVFQSLLSRYQINLETSMNGSSFIFDYVQLLNYKGSKKIRIVVDHI